MKATNPIGIFDSGIGGLSVLKQFVRFLPFESYIYLGDTARVPYGNKSVTTVQQYAKGCTDFLIKQNVKLIVIACNTVSAVALHTIQKLANNIPVIGMIYPAAAAALRNTNNNRIGIIGTRATIASNAYADTIKKLINGNNSVQVFSQECPLFVPFVEEGMIYHESTKLIAKEYLSSLVNENIDTLVLGCTHYPLLSQMIMELMPNTTQIDSGEHAAVTALRLLADQKLLQNEREEFLLKHDIKFYVTDLPSQFLKQAQAFLGFEINSPNLIKID